MKREEANRLLGGKSKRIRGKGKKKPILRAVIKDCNGVEKKAEYSVIDGFSNSIIQ